MKQYQISFAASLEHKPEYPERTAKKFVGQWDDVVYQVWPNRESMLKTIYMQEQGENFRKAWKACQK